MASTSSSFVNPWVSRTAKLHAPHAPSSYHRHFPWRECQNKYQRWMMDRVVILLTTKDDGVDSADRVRVTIARNSCYCLHFLCFGPLLYTPVTFCLPFDWLLPHHSKAVEQGIERWIHTPFSGIQKSLEVSRKTVVWWLSKRALKRGIIDSRRCKSPWALNRHLSSQNARCQTTVSGYVR